MSDKDKEKLEEEGKHEESLRPYERAIPLLANDPNARAAHAVALHSAGATDEALRRLDQVHRRFPADREVLAALIAIHSERGEHEEASRYARRLASLQDPPGDGPSAPAGVRALPE